MQTRKYNGKTYKFYGSYATKGLAEEAVASLKKTHWLGRIFERKSGPFGIHGPFEIYTRKSETQKICPKCWGKMTVVRHMGHANIWTCTKCGYKKRTWRRK